ncbi:VOC family protein [Fusibacter sp. JL298sf-3]
MKARIDLITIWTEALAPMKAFYKDVLGFEVKLSLDSYVEFQNEGVRFAICERQVMHGFSDAFKSSKTGQAFELAFPCASPQAVDESYNRLIEKGAQGVHPPADMPWGQRTALFKDPDGNVHEIFSELS